MDLLSGYNLKQNRSSRIDERIIEMNRGENFQLFLIVFIANIKKKNK